jgi:hypothetical protein
MVCPVRSLKPYIDERFEGYKNFAEVITSPVSRAVAHKEAMKDGYRFVFDILAPSAFSSQCRSQVLHVNPPGIVRFWSICVC